MTPQCSYPKYRIELPGDLMARCLDIAPKLLREAGFQVGNDRFLAHIRGKRGISSDGGRVYFEPDLVRTYIDRFIRKSAAAFEQREGKARQGQQEPDDDWTVTTAGYSMMTIDLETEELRSATSQDLRNYIKLANASGVGGFYMVMPQDLPAPMRTLACFKICFEMSQNIRPYDYQMPEQLPFLYEMHQVMQKPMAICITIPQAMTVDPKDMDILMDYHPVWKERRDVQFGVLDYPMTGISKPVTAPGCAAMCFCETLALHILVNLFDPELELGISLGGAQPTDLRNTCWAWGSPRMHVFRYLRDMLMPNLLGTEVSEYKVRYALLETASPVVDAHAALEKMATGLMAAMQGCRRFGYAGVLCVDDVYSGAQFIIDLEIVEYIREIIESFDPHPDIINIDGLYEECLAVARGEDTFLSHGNTVARFRNIVPSSDLLVREKLRSWMSHGRMLKDRAREIAVERIRAFEPFRLPEDRQKALDRIYEEARKVLA